MNLFMAILALCVLVALNIFQLKRKNTHEKISITFVIVLAFGILIIIGFRILLRKAF
jgi:hypothetical protein